MSSFSAKGLTNKGRSLQAKAQAGAELHYTKFVIGDGQLGGQSISALTNVISPKKTIDVTRLKMTPPDKTTVGFVLSNQDVTAGFYFREIGLYAMDPDDGEILYYYLNAGDTADYIPPTGTGDVIDKSFDVLVYVGQAQNVTLTVDENLVYVTHKELNDAIAGVKVTVDDASLTKKGIVQLSNATNGVSDSKAATEKALGLVMVEANAAKQAGNDRKAEVVAALIAKGVAASTSDTWAQLISKMTAIIVASGDATAADLLSGKTASNKNGPITGNIPVLTGVRVATGVGQWGDGGLAVYPEKGYQKGGIGDGEIKVTTAQLQQAEPDLNSNNILGPANIYGVQGNIANRSAEASHMPSTGSTVWAGDRIFLQPPRGFYDGASWVTAPATDVRPEHILAGKKVLDMTGTAKKGLDYNYVLLAKGVGTEFIDRGNIERGYGNTDVYSYGKAEGGVNIKANGSGSNGDYIGFTTSVPIDLTNVNRIKFTARTDSTQYLTYVDFGVSRTKHTQSTNPFDIKISNSIPYPSSLDTSAYILDVTAATGLFYICCVVYSRNYSFNTLVKEIELLQTV